jgi:hypothetical protein
VASIFLATTGRGLARAEWNASDIWAVTFSLDVQDVRCLAHDALYPEVVYAGTEVHSALYSRDQGKTWQPAGLGTDLPSFRRLPGRRCWFSPAERAPT